MCPFQSGAQYKLDELKLGGEIKYTQIFLQKIHDKSLHTRYDTLQDMTIWSIFYDLWPSGTLSR